MRDSTPPQALPDDPLAVLAMARQATDDETLAACHRKLKSLWPEWAAGTVAGFAKKLRAAVSSNAGHRPALALEAITGPEAMREGEAYLCATVGDTTGVYRIQNGPPPFVYVWAQPRPIMAQYQHFLKIVKVTE